MFAIYQDRESEPRFSSGPPGGGGGGGGMRGGFEGGPPRGGFGGGYGGGMGGGMPAGGPSSQIYVSNVCPCNDLVLCMLLTRNLASLYRGLARSQRSFPSSR